MTASRLDPNTTHDEPAPDIENVGDQIGRLRYCSAAYAPPSTWI